MKRNYPLLSILRLRLLIPGICPGQMDETEAGSGSSVPVPDTRAVSDMVQPVSGDIIPFDPIIRGISIVGKASFHDTFQNI